jgi:SAM-dependent methyltransferase
VGDAIPNPAGKEILEIGCGRGETSIYLAQKGALMTATDLGEHLVKFVEEYSAILGVHLRISTASATSLPFEDSSFDAVVGTAILHHLSEQNLVQCLKEVRRVLRPRGIAVFLEPVENSRLWDFLQNLLPRGRPGQPGHRPSWLSRRAFRAYKDCLDDRPLTDRELIAAGAGFSSVHLEYHGLLIRLESLVPGLREFLKRCDRMLTGRRSPIRRLSQQVVVRYAR